MRRLVDPAQYWRLRHLLAEFAAAQGAAEVARLRVDAHLRALGCNPAVPYRCIDEAYALDDGQPVEPLPALSDPAEAG